MWEKAGNMRASKQPAGAAVIVRLTHLHVLNAILYVAERGCKWRGLPARSWRNVYRLAPDYVVQHASFRLLIRVGAARSRHA